MNPIQLRELIIRPTLEDMGAWSQAAENLLLGTAAQESLCGRYIKQLRGPALGIYQMEPMTHNDIIVNKDELLSYVKPPYEYERLLYDMDYSTRLCRLHYLRIIEPLPGPTDIESLGRYWKKYYNTIKGHGSVLQFVENYEKYISKHVK